MKRIICLVFVLVTSFSLCAAVTANAVLYGDANGDGKINSRDVITIMRYIVDKTTSIDVQAANVMKSSYDDSDRAEINARDVITLMKYIVGENIILGKDIPTSVPPAEMFSDEYLEPRYNPIVRIKSATLYKNGTVTEFAPDDPKIIRLINFISYPEEDMCISTAMDGCWNDEEIAQKRTESFRMEIEVENNHEYGNHMFSCYRSEQFDRLVIFGGEVLEYSYREVDKNADDGDDYMVTALGCTRCAESYWPYEELGYINILEWCGF